MKTPNKAHSPLTQRGWEKKRFIISSQGNSFKKFLLFSTPISRERSFCLPLAEPSRAEEEEEEKLQAGRQGRGGKSWQIILVVFRSFNHERRLFSSTSFQLLSILEKFTECAAAAAAARSCGWKVTLVTPRRVESGRESRNILRSAKSAINEPAAAYLRSPPPRLGSARLAWCSGSFIRVTSSLYSPFSPYITEHRPPWLRKVVDALVYCDRVLFILKILIKIQMIFMYFVAMGFS